MPCLWQIAQQEDFLLDLTLPGFVVLQVQLAAVSICYCVDSKIVNVSVLKMSKAVIQSCCRTGWEPSTCAAFPVQLVQMPADCHQDKEFPTCVMYGAQKLGYKSDFKIVKVT